MNASHRARMSYEDDFEVWKEHTRMFDLIQANHNRRSRRVPVTVVTRKNGLWSWPQFTWTTSNTTVAVFTGTKFGARREGWFCPTPASACVDIFHKYMYTNGAVGEVPEVISFTIRVSVYMVPVGDVRSQGYHCVFRQGASVPSLVGEIDLEFKSVFQPVQDSLLD